jgi:LytR cell envelope-related transcriptional attenuator
MLAWVGIAALVGLAVCGLWALTDMARGRAADDDRLEGAPLRRRWSRIALITMICVGCIVVVFGVAFVVVTDRQGAGSDTGSPVATGPTTTTRDPTLPHPPQQVRIAIVNASAFPKPATVAADTLRSKGYVILGTTNAQTRQGTAVQCRTGYELDAAALARDFGATTVVEPFPDPPPDAGQTDCIVVVGRP